MIDRADSGSRIRLVRAALLAGGFAVIAGLTGCSGADSGVELNGKLFDAVGLSGGSKSRSEPKLAERAPLVPPPRVDALPTPGSGQESAGHMAWPNDPDRQRAAAAVTAKKSLDKRCSDPMIGRPEPERVERDAQCQAEKGGLLSTATSWMSGKKASGEAASTTTDEGDPGAAGIVTGSTSPAKGQKAAVGSKTR
jgi:hypothetical protein